VKLEVEDHCVDQLQVNPLGYDSHGTSFELLDKLRMKGENL